MHFHAVDQQTNLELANRLGRFLTRWHERWHLVPAEHASLFDHVQQEAGALWKTPHLPRFARAADGYYGRPEASMYKRHFAGD
jgi:hypothetical protein